MDDSEDLGGAYVLDVSHSRLGFVARHAVVTRVRGEFADFSGTAHIDTVDPRRSSVSVTVDAASLSTGSTDRDAYLVSPDFLDVATYPDLSFVSTAVARAGDDWSITGDLTIKDSTQSVEIGFLHTGSAEDPSGNDRLGFEGSVTVRRKDWGLTWNAAVEAGGVIVSDKIRLELEISAIRAESS